MDIKHLHYQSAGGIRIQRIARAQPYQSAVTELAKNIDHQRGVLLASSFEYPGRYTRWDIGFVNPPIEISSQGLEMVITALNQRGEVLLVEIFRALASCQELARSVLDHKQILVTVTPTEENFSEELRSRRATVFSVLRTIIRHFSSAEDDYLGLYGAFGYDLTFQFEDVDRHQVRAEDDRDLVLYLPDEILVCDHRAEVALCHSYEFVCRAIDAQKFTETTGGFKRTGVSQAYIPATSVEKNCDHAVGEYAANVDNALAHFRRGDLFEVVPGQTFFEACKSKPSEVFNRLKQRNPAPYGALMNLGQQEYLVAASPEMFVRVRGRNIETCPISGTIKRGDDAIADARQIKTLLNSDKDEAELSMCTDVDRNDKARVCEPGSIEVVGRRQIEMYSRLIHTVDHVRGVLKPEFDALDGFLAHTWAVTVTGAPKLAAMQFIEQQEKSPRRWYGGAMGQLGFNGNINTGLTLRTMRIKSGVAEIRAGATLLVDSDPHAEEAETRLKASALRDAVRNEGVTQKANGTIVNGSTQFALQVLMVDHQDSFVHNLASYFRQFGVDLITMRPMLARQWLQDHHPDLVVLSPGPFQPDYFQMQQTLRLCQQKSVSVFGVCLGLQGLVEYFGGKLGQLDYPMHGKPSEIEHTGSKLFSGITSRFTAGRYHSLFALDVPDCLAVTARTDENVVMAVEHRSAPLTAVQFHPESILSLDQRVGHQLVANVLTAVALRIEALANKEERCSG